MEPESKDASAVGRRTLTESRTSIPHLQLSAVDAPPVQLDRGGSAIGDSDVHEAARDGIAGQGAALPHLEAIQQSFGDHDVSDVRAHVGGAAAQATSAMGAAAYASGNHVAFAAAPDLHTAAHEAAHVVQQRAGVTLPGGVGREGDTHERHADEVAERVTRGEPAGDLLGVPGGRAGTRDAIQRKTKGEEVYDKAHANWLDPHVSVKADVDVLKAAQREINAGKSVDYNQGAGKKRIASALTTLGRSKELAGAEAEWDWLVEHRKTPSSADYKAKQQALMKRLQTPLAELGAKHPKAHTQYWLKNSPPQVLDVIISAADSEIAADQLWAYANVEGLVDYVRNSLGLGKHDDPTEAQLKSVSTTSSISGFDYLGTDDFFTDLNAKQEPLSSHLPKGYDLSKVSLDKRTNEQKREVQSAIFPDLKSGLQGLAASLKRRRALFRADVGKYKYAAPTTEELVYWTYIYFNAGEFNGQLKKYQGKRKLGDWITKGEYPNSIKLLESYRMVKSMAIF